ncbi:MAG: hypothetical protein WD336_02315 [Trueperaceae bacterium]
MGSIRALAGASDAVVSVCPPHGAEGVAWLHLSGPDASEVAGWFAGGPPDAGDAAPDGSPFGRFEPRVISDRIGDATALKVAFAAWTKGSTALKAAMLAYAEAAGVREALRAQ